ncbi:protein transport protein Sec24C-like [Patiria miniata]|uniref:Protein transport protein Sec24C n=1 Tax=Patiria miniata TaxID=46514 RepID=A0A914AAU1_PATMI|nr:protein transport protein Sec24C-like [Patiria miniata]XP_038060983.1 protein transport protein Sec24C-like [Patiria miniata]
MSQYMNQGPPQQQGGYNQQQNYGAPPPQGRGPGQYGAQPTNNYYGGVNTQPPPTTGPPPMGPPAQGAKQPMGAFGEGRGNYPQQGYGPGVPAMNGPSSQGVPPTSSNQQPAYGQPPQNNGYGGPPPASSGAPPLGGPPTGPGQTGYGGQQNRVPAQPGPQTQPPASQAGYYQPQQQQYGSAPGQLSNQMAGMNLSGPQRGMGPPPTSMAHSQPPPSMAGPPGPGMPGPPSSMNAPQHRGMPPSSMPASSAPPAMYQTQSGAPPPTGPPYSVSGPTMGYQQPGPASGPMPPMSPAGGPLRPGGAPPYGNVGQPGMGQPGMRQSGMAPPGMGQPGMAQPGMGQPGMGQPGMGQPGMGQPGMAQPGMAQPGMGQPGMAQPGMGQPGMAQPGMGQPGMAQPGMAQPGMAQPGMGQPQQKRLDPDQMPSVIQVIEDDKKNRGNQQFITNVRGLVPPLVTTEFQVIDQGNCSPRFMRSTMYNIPCTQDMIKQSQAPIGLVISPFAKLPDNEPPPPIVDHGPNGPVRCNRCKAYMCSFMQFVDGGRRFSCAFCTCITEVPPEYFQPLDHNSRRVDAYERAELSRGTFEYLATADYCKNNTLPKPPAFIFMIDVTYQSIKTGMVHLLCKELHSLLEKLPCEHGMKESVIRVGFVTYDSSLHFYNLNSALAQPQMLVVSDVHDVFLPLLDGFLVNLSESKAVIESLLEQIPQMFAETRETETMLGPVVQAGLEAIKSSDRVGKLFVFHASLPIADAPGKLKNRDDRKLLGTEKEKTLLSPQTNFYTKLGQDCVAAGCSVDLFLFPNSYVDVATIGQVSSQTGGQCYKYNYFQAANDGERFIQDLTNNIQRPIGFDAVLRVRTSTGIRPTDFFGNFYMANTTDVELAAIDSDKAITVEIKHDDKLSEDAGAFVQVAVLYTSVSGQRRLRVINQSYNCCQQMADMYRNCEMDAIINFLSKQAVNSVLTSNPKAIREGLTNRCAATLACYRRNCATPSSQGQLILPECMKLLPLYINCVLKSDALSGSTDITTDDRSWLMDTVRSMDVASTAVYFYPRLTPLHDLNPNSPSLPTALRCSVERLRDNGVYLLENGNVMFLWIGLHVSNDWVQDVFGVHSPAQIDIDSSKLLHMDNPTSQGVRNLVERVRKTRPRYMKLTFVRQRDTLEAWFRHFLVEDKGSNASASYVDFLVHMHKEIRNLLN